MAKGAAARAAARKQKDKWKAKRWYKIRAPRNPWSFKEIGETLAEEENMLIGRKYEMMQNELDGDFSKMHIKIKFQVNNVIGSDALTEFVGHAVMKDYERRQIRRERGKIDDTVDLVTEDGYFIRLKPFIVTRSRAKSSQKQQSRMVVRNEIIKFCSSTTWLSVQKALLDGTLEKLITAAATKVQPVRSAFFKKSELIQSGVVMEEGPTLEEIKAQELESAEPEDSQLTDNEEEETMDEVSPEPEIEDVEEKEDTDDSTDDNSDSEISDNDEEDNKETIEEESSLADLKGKLKADLVKIADNLNLDSKGTKPELINRIYNSLSVADLKNLLKEVGKPVSGKKSELIDRLME